jgi:hypothetical protein
VPFSEKMGVGALRLCVGCSWPNDRYMVISVAMTHIMRLSSLVYCFVVYSYIEDGVCDFFRFVYKRRVICMQLPALG